MRENQTPEKKQQEKTATNIRVKAIRGTKKELEDNSFLEVQNSSKVDHSILDTEAFKIIKQRFDEAVAEAPEFDCDICWQMLFKRNVRQLKPENYENDEKQKHLFEKCKQGISTWICNSCHANLKNGEMPAVAIAKWT